MIQLRYFIIKHTVSVTMWLSICYLLLLMPYSNRTINTSFVFLFQVIGSSLLFVHDHRHASVWLIDFAKTLLLPDEVSINHSSHWVVGNHEDGYLIGINNLISLFLTLLESHPVCITPPLSAQEPSEWQEKIQEKD